MLGDPPEVGRDPLEVAAERVADLLETIAAEFYRVRVAVEVMAGAALDLEAAALERAARRNDHPPCLAPGCRHPDHDHERGP